MTAKQRERQQARRHAHAMRQDNRRPKGSELLSDIRKRERAAKRAPAAPKRVWGRKS